MKAKEEISDKWPTVFELASQIQEVDLTQRRVRGGRNRPAVTKGLTPEPFPATEGYVVATPEQVASLRVPKIEVNGDIRGFQREKLNAHARKIARAMLNDEEMPPIIVSIFPDGNAYVGEGQHRAIGAIIARKNLECVVKRRTVEQARRLFTNQGKAKNLKSDDTLLTGNSPIELYVQDAVTDPKHPWADMVGTYNSDTRMGPTTMAHVVGAFVHNSMNTGVLYHTSRHEDEFNVKEADKLAELIKAFGTKETNPLAFRGRMLRAISYAAIYIFKRNPALKSDDYNRWKRHMASFDFGKYPHLLLREGEMATMLVAHWNKRLPESRKVQPWTYR